MEQSSAPVKAGTGGRAGAEQSDSADTGSSDAPTTGGGNPGAVNSYLAKLSAYLERHKEYPRRARLRRQEGVVQLRFVVDSTGKVLSYQVASSSGHQLLDAEVERMIAQASPLPAPPPEMITTTLELVLPVSFYLR